jgi:hypothetical protein
MDLHENDENGAELRESEKKPDMTRAEFQDLIKRSQDWIRKLDEYLGKDSSPDRSK